MSLYLGQRVALGPRTGAIIDIRSPYSVTVHFDSGGVDDVDPNTLHYASDDYPELADIIWERPSPEKALDGDPYLRQRSRYRPRKTASASTTLSPSVTGDSGQMHTDNEAPPGSMLAIDFIPLEPGVMCSYCGVNPAECTVNGATLCLEDAEDHWGIDVSEAAGTPGVPGEAPEPPQEGLEDQDEGSGALEPHVAAGGHSVQIYENSKVRDLKALHQEMDQQGVPETHPIRGVVGKYYGAHLAVSRKDGRITGGVVFYPNDKRTGGQHHIIQVRAMEKGQGAGRALFQAVAQHAMKTKKNTGLHITGATGDGPEFYRHMGGETPSYQGKEYMPSSWTWDREATERLAGSAGEHEASLHEAMSQYQGDHTFVFHKANPKSMGGSKHHMLEAWDQDHPLAHVNPRDRVDTVAQQLGHYPNGQEFTGAGMNHLVGRFAWLGNTGEIKKVEVDPKARRQGLATELLRRAKEIAMNTRGVRPPRHSTNRTNEGEAWARSLDQRLPKRDPWRIPVAAWHPSDADEDNLYDQGGSHHVSQGRWFRRHTSAVGDAEWHQRWTENSPAHPSPSWVMDGAHDYRRKMGLTEEYIDYPKVMADKDHHARISQAYEDIPEHDERARPAFEALRNEMNHQYDHMVNHMGMRVEATKHDPYADHKEMIDDVAKNRRMQVLATNSTGGHPFFTPEENDRFRAVHDFFGHAATGRGFDRHGEEAAWRHHSSMFSPLARAALTTETRGQNAQLIHKGSFPVQKMALLPEEFHNEEALHNFRTGAWRDVMNKAKRLRADHAVHLLETPTAQSPYVFAEVKGDNALYHCFIGIKGDEQGEWSCSCDWGDYGPNGPLADERAEKSPYKRRPCSHILASRWELQSRTMFGKSPYTGALYEKEGAMETDILDDWFTGRFLVEARGPEAPQYPEGRIAPHKNLEGVPFPTKGRPGKFGRNPRATNFEDLPADHQQMIRDHFAKHFTDEDGNPLSEDKMVQNVKDMYHSAKESDENEDTGHKYLDEGGKWYQRAHNQIHEWANKYGVKSHQLMGAAAALSPSTDWDSNLTMTHYFARHLGPNAEPEHAKLRLDPSKFTPKQLAKWHKQPTKSRGNPEGLSHAQIADKYGLTDGRSFASIKNHRAAAHALHLQQHYTDHVKKDFGGEMVEDPHMGSSWQSADSATKAVKMIRGARGASPDRVLSGSKVRSFFNNIRHPGQTDDLTIDSHAASMIVGAKMGASSKALKRSMELQGADKSTQHIRNSLNEQHNVQGGYAYMAHVMRRAHSELVADKNSGLSSESSPADLQAITWKRWRDLMPGQGGDKKRRIPTLYTPKGQYRTLTSHLVGNHDEDEDDGDWGHGNDGEEDELPLDPYGGPDEPDPDLYPQGDEEDECPDDDDDDEDEDEEDGDEDSDEDEDSDDDDNDQGYSRRHKAGAMYDWTGLLRQARRERLAEEATAVTAPLRAPEVPLQYLPQTLVQHHLSSGMDEFGFERQADPAPSLQWQQQHSPGANNPADTAPANFGEPLDPLDRRGPYADERLLEPGGVTTDPLRSLDQSWSGTVASAQGGGGGGGYYAQAPLVVQVPPQPVLPAEGPEAAQILSEHQAGLEYLRPPSGGPVGQPGASAGMSREALLAQHQADNAQLAAGAEAFLRSGSIPVPGMEVNMDTILSMPPGSLTGMGHEAKSRDFTPAEQDEMVREGELEGVRASNLHMLQLQGSMYEELERQLSTDDQSEASANALWW